MDSEFEAAKAITDNSMLQPLDMIVDNPVVIFDLEYTTWEGAMERGWTGPGEFCEIVQIGAVKLDRRRGFAETSDFQILVKPQINPDLSEYFIDLTGITQERVDVEGISFPEALAAFKAFIGEDNATLYSLGGDEKHIYLNCGLHRLSCPIDMQLFRDIMPAFQNALDLGPQPIVTSQLPELLGFEIPGRAHDALDDARCIAEGLRVLDRRS